MSIKENIIFGKEFIEENYLNILKICALENDLKGWARGDLTEISINDTMLSCG